jgi:DNA primase large subunit
MDEAKMQGKFSLTLKNADVLNKYFPPCMINLQQNLKLNHHLKHDGRRQLWNFFKACGMDIHDNKEYFRRHMESKVTASEMKQHIYNIEHAYGLQGKRKAENAWKCRKIITGNAPKKGEHHGCPFAHWRDEELGSFLRKNYKVTEEHMNEIMAEKNEKHFQVACGRLFEYSELNSSNGTISSEITAKLGIAPHLFYEAGMELKDRREKEKDGASAMKPEDKESIEF